LPIGLAKKKKKKEDFAVLIYRERFV
jgi:hypothetical protein